jgi:hypothetical protein
MGNNRASQYFSVTGHGGEIEALIQRWRIRTPDLLQTIMKKCPQKYLMYKKVQKWEEIYQNSTSQGLGEIGLFGTKLYHLATLLICWRNVIFSCIAKLLKKQSLNPYGNVERGALMALLLCVVRP